MTINDILARLRRATDKKAEAERIKRELRSEPLLKRSQIRTELLIESNQKENDDIIDALNDILKG